MQVKIPVETDKRLKEASHIFGFSEEDIIERAIIFYLDVIEKQLDLKREFKELDILSDEAILNFEKSL